MYSKSQRRPQSQSTLSYWRKSSGLDTLKLIWRGIDVKLWWKYYGCCLGQLYLIATGVALYYTWIASMHDKVLSLTSKIPTHFRTLQWVRQDAPIIIHVNLDRVLQFLVEDTHYRNLFEVGTGGGSTDFSARKSWEVISFIPRHFYPDGCHLQYASATNDKCLPWGDKTWLQG